MSENNDFVLETDDTLFSKVDDALPLEMKEFRKGYHNSIMQFQKQYNLRSKRVSAES